MGETDRIPYRVAEGTPETLDELRYFVVNEFRRIQQALTEIDAKLIDLEDRITVLEP